MADVQEVFVLVLAEYEVRMMRAMLLAPAQTMGAPSHLYLDGRGLSKPIVS